MKNLTQNLNNISQDQQPEIDPEKISTSPEVKPLKEEEKSIPPEKPMAPEPLPEQEPLPQEPEIDPDKIS